jgi:DNA-binding response OmpR family regulator
MPAAGNGGVLVADDDEAMRLLCRVNLELEGYTVFEAASRADVERLVDAESIALVLLDIRLGDDDGVEVARAVKSAHPKVAVAFLTGSVPEGEEAPPELVDGVVRKPFTLEELSETVHRLARR